ncbi:MAG TPA: hypothetical protein VFG14_18630 [Chthoniobacteraceae bacterium]|nr:hypothetical protein [Chthoniobacteraceae bacterium]
MLLLSPTLDSQAVQGIPPQPITDINSEGDSDPGNFVSLDRKIFFTAFDGAKLALYSRNLEKRIDGEPAIDPEIDLTLPKHKPARLRRFPEGTEFGEFLPVNEQFKTGSSKTARLYFHVRGQGLWTSRGTPSSTLKLKDVDAGDDESQWMHSLTAINDNGDATKSLVLFSAISPTKGSEVFTTRGKASNTKLFDDIVPGPESGFPHEYADASVEGEAAYFFGAFNDERQSFNIYYSPGIPGEAIDILGTENGLIQGFLDIVTLPGNDSVAFIARDQSGTTQYLGIVGLTLSLNTYGSVTPTFLAPFNSQVLVIGDGLDANSQPAGEEVYSLSEGTVTLLHNINAGTGSSNPNNFVQASSSTMYFSATPDGLARRLYRTNGMPNGLEEIADESGSAIHTENAAQIIALTKSYNGQDHGQDVYYVGTATAGTYSGQTILWRVRMTEVNGGKGVAHPVLTEMGFPILNVRNLGKLVDPGSPGIYRLFFQSDGEGTEHAGRGTEVWCYERAD